MRFFLDLLGCAKNQVDAEIMAAHLHAAGWERASDLPDAELIIVNSCGFIESAKKETVDEILGLRAAYPHKKILLAGCLAQRYAVSLKDDFNEVDGFFGNARLSAISEAAADVMAGKRPCLTPLVSKADRPDVLGSRPLFSFPGSAYVKISEGCDNRCGFCAIPLIRGPLRSRPVGEVLNEIRQLLERGIKELCLIGQDLGAYGMDTADTPRLVDLLRAVSALSGAFWVRLLYIHPNHFPEGLLELCGADRRILPYFDLPFQHVSEPILRQMKRKGGASDYLGLIERIRAALPDAIIRSTFLVGFPGESEEDFDRLLDFQTRADLDWLGVFAYSREEDTPAYALPKRVPKKIALERKRRLEIIQTSVSARRMDRFAHREMTALIEEKVEGEAGLYLARVYCQAPEVDGATVVSSAEPLTPGEFVPVRILRRVDLDLDAVYAG